MDRNGWLGILGEKLIYGAEGEPECGSGKYPKYTHFISRHLLDNSLILRVIDLI
jgi:hypothetical protein